MSYRIVRSPYFRQTDYALARRYVQLVDALADMGNGIVLRDNGDLVAFHERHLRTLTTLGWDRAGGCGVTTRPYLTDGITDRETPAHTPESLVRDQREAWERDVSEKLRRLLTGGALTTMQ